MRRAAWLIAAVIAAVAIAGSCASPASPVDPAGTIPVLGTVQHYTFEGGFWAVRGDDGVTYDPLGGLPFAFRSEGLRVMMVARVRNDLVGIHMAGPIVEILEIQPI